MPRLKHWVNVGASNPATPLPWSTLNRVMPATCAQCRLQHDARRRLLLGSHLAIGYTQEVLSPITMNLRGSPCWLSDHDRVGIYFRRTSNSWMWNPSRR